MFSKRQISKLPSTPKFSDKLIGLVTSFIFQKDVGHDLTGKTLMVPGNIAWLNHLVTKMQDLQTSESDIILAGGINPVYKNNFSPETILMKLLARRNKIEWKDIRTKPESQIIHEIFLKKIRIPKNFYIEEQSTNMRENFQKAKQHGYFDGLSQLVILSDAAGALRNKLTARAVLNDKIPVETISYDVHYNGPFMNDMKVPFLNLHLSKFDWSENFFARKMVWGEVLRIKKYGDKGDIKIDAEIKEKLSDIMQNSR